MQWLPSLNHEQRSTVLHEASSMIDPQSTAALSKHTLLFSIQPEQTQTHACTHVRTCRCECKTQQTMNNLFSRFPPPHLSHIHKHKHTQAHTNKYKHKHTFTRTACIVLEAGGLLMHVLAWRTAIGDTHVDILVKAAVFLGITGGRQGVVLAWRQCP